MTGHIPNELFRNARLARMLTQRELAELLGVGENTVNGWERGRSRPLKRIMPDVLRELGVQSPQELGFTAEARRRPRGTVKLGRSGQEGGGVLNRRDLLVVVAAGMCGSMTTGITRMFPVLASPSGLIGSYEVEQVRQIRRHSYGIQRMLGGGAIDGRLIIRQYGVLLGQLSRGRFSSASVRQQMHEAVAHFGASGAWSLVEQGMHGQAQRLYGAALAVASGTVPDRRDSWRALLIGGMARHAIYRGDHGTALALLDHLDPDRADVADDVRSVLLSRRARALAGLGDHREVARLVARAEDSFGGSEQKSATTFDTVAFGASELANDIGHAWATLAIDHGAPTPAEAVSSLDTCIETYGPHDRRSSTLAGVMLANVHITQGDAADAIRTARRLVEPAQAVRSARIDHEIANGIRLAKSQPGRQMQRVVALYRELRPAA